MKKQINPTIKAHLIRGAFYLLLLVAVCAIPFALGERYNTRTTKAQPVVRQNALPYGVRGLPALPGLSQVPQRTSGVRAAHVLPIPRAPKVPQVVLYDQYQQCWCQRHFVRYVHRLPDF